MTCHVCGAKMEPVVSDLPFKLSDQAIVILQGVSVLQCAGCREFLIEDSVMSRIDAILEKIDSTEKVEIIRFAA
jgi:YgiT-type zinc finger domain-containing protein